MQQAEWSILSNTGLIFMWLGLNDLDVEGSFLWTDGTPLDYEKWFPGRPEANGGDCVLSLIYLGWIDYPCNVPQAFLCKTPP